jgi:hypothetical protein
MIFIWREDDDGGPGCRRRASERHQRVRHQIDEQHVEELDH